MGEASGCYKYSATPTSTSRLSLCCKSYPPVLGIAPEMNRLVKRLPMIAGLVEIIHCNHSNVLKPVRLYKGPPARRLRNPPLPAQADCRGSLAHGAQQSATSAHFLYSNSTEAVAQVTIILYYLYAA